MTPFARRALLPLVLATFVAPWYARAETKPDAAPAAPAEVALTPVEVARSRELQELVVSGKALVTKFAETDGTRETELPQSEKERLVRAIIDRYESLLREDPRHVDTLILYGKFLRSVGEREAAFKMFLRADRVSPDLAVVKHQLAAHLAEDAEYAEALPLFRRATELAPAEPRYRYDFGEFLTAAGDALATAGKLSREDRDRLMLQNFIEAAKLRPSEAGFRWRAAEAYYDMSRPDAAAALAAWDAIAKDAKSPAETEVIGLHRARWLIALGRSAEARKLIVASVTPALDGSRKKLVDLLQKNEPGLVAPVTPAATDFAPAPSVK